MKRLQIVFLILAIGCTILACGCKKQQILPETELAFCDFVLGGDSEECYEKAKSNPQYEGLSLSQEGLLEHATFFSIKLPNYENPDYNIYVMDGKVDSYQGIIYHIHYESPAVETIIGMYQRKYGDVEPKRYESTEMEYDRGDSFKRTIVHFDYKWLFENAEIYVRERYRDDYGSKKDVKVSVEYIDTNVSKEALPYMLNLFEQKDSIEQVEAERERIMREKKEQEEQHIKKEKENAILESMNQ